MIFGGFLYLFPFQGKWKKSEFFDCLSGVILQLLFLHDLLGTGQTRSWSGLKNADADIEQLRTTALRAALLYVVCSS